MEVNRWNWPQHCRGPRPNWRSGTVAGTITKSGQNCSGPNGLQWTWDAGPVAYISAGRRPNILTIGEKWGQSPLLHRTLDFDNFSEDIVKNIRNDTSSAEPYLIGQFCYRHQLCKEIVHYINDVIQSGPYGFVQNQITGCCRFVQQTSIIVGKNMIAFPLLLSEQCQVFVC